MKLKANLHLHASDDTEDSINYSFIDALNEAQKLGFSVLTLTCHNTLVDKPEYHAEAERRSILFIPGIERTIEGKHVVILNPTAEVMRVRTFAELAAYKRAHPQIFIIAPHPYLGARYSLNDELFRHPSLFDAVEQTWFYSTFYNPNKKAAAAAARLSLPLIATSDTHDLRFLNVSYAEVEVAEQSIPALFAAIRNRRFNNVSSKRSLIFELVPYVLVHLYRFYTGC